MLPTLPTDMICHSLYNTNIKTFTQFSILSRGWKDRIDQNVGDICYRSFEKMATYTPNSKYLDSKERLAHSKKIINKLVRREKVIKNMEIKTFEVSEIRGRDFLLELRRLTQCAPYSTNKRFNYCLAFCQGTIYFLTLAKQPHIDRSIFGMIVNNQFQGHERFPLAAIPHFAKTAFDGDHYQEITSKGSLFYLSGYGYKDKLLFVKTGGFNTYWQINPLKCIFATDNSHPLLNFSGTKILYQKDTRRVSIWDYEKKEEVLEIDLPIDSEIETTQAIFSRKALCVRAKKKLLWIETDDPKKVVVLHTATHPIEKCSYFQQLNLFFVCSKKTLDIVNLEGFLKSLDCDEFIGSSFENFVVKNLQDNSYHIYSLKTLEMTSSIKILDKEESTFLAKNKFIIASAVGNQRWRIHIINIDTGQMLNLVDIYTENLETIQLSASDHILSCILGSRGNVDKRIIYFFDLVTGKYIDKLSLEGCSMALVERGRLAVFYPKLNTGFAIYDYTRSGSTKNKRKK